jgi:hypothetical protein
MFDDNFNAEVDKYIEKLKKCEYILEKEVKKLCLKAKEILSSEENVIRLHSPITVIAFNLDMWRYTWSIP